MTISIEDTWVWANLDVTQPSPASDWASAMTLLEGLLCGLGFIFVFACLVEDWLLVPQLQVQLDT